MFRDEVKPLWKGVETYTYNFETFTINYKFNGEHRSIFLCFSHSYKDEIGDFEKLYVSLGMSGNTRLPVFGAIIEALREAKYEQWFINNDCDDNTPPHFVDDNFKISDYE
ncbi:hypothetical protein HYO65_gp106 [Tenacibaculum phage PTm1]|uniref:Uncharacterized protein n=1 Tax=Tenacibaculum phage PTm1 TaxID=2547425 RepID=A0A5S9BZ30_9CAUD|nr:hypothetical protein HYO65_gp106 [Tenacibaculum phage PTm1]BBI90498.1 hypothetical protein [Tenacibaculum phage PTm1]